MVYKWKYFTLIDYLFPSVDVGDLQRFVTIALGTAAGGEDDLANDKLSRLRTVGSGFSSLIYELKDNAGFAELCDSCSSVWTAYNNNPFLPDMLVSCIAGLCVHVC